MKKAKIMLGIIAVMAIFFSVHTLMSFNSNPSQGALDDEYRPQVYDALWARRNQWSNGYATCAATFTVTNTGANAAGFCELYFLEYSTINKIRGYQIDSLVSIEVPALTSLKGNFSYVNLASGKCLAIRR